MKRLPLPLPFRFHSKSFVKHSLGILTSGLLAFAPPQALATGGWVPERWLDAGGNSLRGTPQFYWDIEMKRLAGVFAEKDCPFKLKLSTRNQDDESNSSDLTAQADAADFEDAINTKRLQPPDAETALEAHQAVRAWLNGPRKDAAPTAEEFASEFADYHKGAMLPNDQAKLIWEKLLQRPANERHYRSVWAAFMLGKVCMTDAKTRAESIKWFEKCREFARAGFADSLGLAADSYGWQARAEYDLENYPASARHYFQQLALGDRSAQLSLKMMVPDEALMRELPALSLTPEPPEEPAAPKDAEPKTGEPEPAEPAEEAPKPAIADPAKAQAMLVAAAKDDALRQIVTASILIESSSLYYRPADDTRITQWLAALEQAKLKNIEDAASLGWIAYSSGKFDEAARWQAMDKSSTPMGQWLKAKLALRKGAFAEASKIMAGVVSALPVDEGTRYEYGYLPRASAAADLGASLLAQGKFVEALDAFWDGNCWKDAAYVAERTVTTEELVQFVKTKAVLKPEEKDQVRGDEVTPAQVDVERKRNIAGLAARRLIREGKIAEGRALLDETTLGYFDNYQQLIATGENIQKPKPERAKAYFKAALMLRGFGWRWRGTEDDLERIEWGGYSNGGGEELVTSRLIGVVKAEDSEPDENGKKPAKTQPLFIPSTPLEKKRIAQSNPKTAKLLSFTTVASDHAAKSAALLEDNTEELADVLNSAGRWIQDIDNPAADKLYFQLEKRAAKTQIGKAVIEKHWFIEPQGPWTDEPEEPEAK